MTIMVYHYISRILHFISDIVCYLSTLYGKQFEPLSQHDAENVLQPQHFVEHSLNSYISIHSDSVYRIR